MQYSELICCNAIIKLDRNHAMPTFCNDSAFVVQFNNNSFEDKGNFAVYRYLKIVEIFWLHASKPCNLQNIKRQPH